MMSRLADEGANSFQVLHGKEEQKPEPRNRGRQRYCAEALPRASKAASLGRRLSPLRRCGLPRKGSLWAGQR
jgi:hypothetical protein